MDEFTDLSPLEEEPPFEPKFSVDAIKKIVGAKPKTAVQALDKIENLLKDKAVWIKSAEGMSPEGDEIDTVGGDTPSVQFCLIGAVRRIDGPTEDMVTLAIATAAAKLFPKRSSWKLIGVLRDATDVERVFDLKHGIRIAENSSLSCEDIVDNFPEENEALNREIVEEAITDFNDHSKTTHKDVLKVIVEARHNLELLDSLRATVRAAEEAYQAHIVDATAIARWLVSSPKPKKAKRPNTAKKKSKK